MIETEQSVVVKVPIDGVWDYVQDIRRWANRMPGLQDCAIIDADDSRWTLKVGVGGLVRTVKVLVHVDQWSGPGRALFSYKLEGDPVKGGGSYTAVAQDDGSTQVTLQVRVEGTGPMAPMWEAMGKPMLPQFAKSFAEQLKSEIEAAAGVAVARIEHPSLLSIICAKLRAIIRSLFGSGRKQRTAREEPMS